MPRNAIYALAKCAMCGETMRYTWPGKQTNRLLDALAYRYQTCYNMKCTEHGLVLDITTGERFASIRASFPDFITEHPPVIQDNPEKADLELVQRALLDETLNVYYLPNRSVYLLVSACQAMQVYPHVSAALKELYKEVAQVLQSAYSDAAPYVIDVLAKGWDRAYDVTTDPKQRPEARPIYRKKKGKRR